LFTWNHNSIDTYPFQVTRSRSVSDLAGYYRYSDKYKPQWHTVYQTTPYRWRRDWDLDFLKRSLLLLFTTLLQYLQSNKTILLQLRYDYDYPYYYRRYWNSAYYRYLYDTYTPYRYRSTIRHTSYLLDSLSTSLGRLIPYRTLDTYWLTPSYWDRRFKDWRELYSTTKDIYLPTTFDRKTRSYFATWST
ncbi:hypothetical protein COOONC_16046, partial [Cooperia oncophora]